MTEATRRQKRTWPGVRKAYTGPTEQLGNERKATAASSGWLTTYIISYPQRKYLDTFIIKVSSMRSVLQTVSRCNSAFPELARHAIVLRGVFSFSIISLSQPYSLRIVFQYWSCIVHTPPGDPIHFILSSFYLTSTCTPLSPSTEMFHRFLPPGKSLSLAQAQPTQTPTAEPCS